MPPVEEPRLEPTDLAVTLLQETRQLLLRCQAVAEELRTGPQGGEPVAHAAERIAYGVLVAALEEGLGPTLPARDGRAQALQRARPAAGRGVARRAGAQTPGGGREPLDNKVVSGLQRFVPTEAPGWRP